MTLSLSIHEPVNTRMFPEFIRPNAACVITILKLTYISNSLSGYFAVKKFEFRKQRTLYFKLLNTINAHS